MGVKQRFSDIPDSGEILVGKKKVMWYDLYKFTEEQEEKWRGWAIEELRKTHIEKEAKEWLMFIDLVYGFVLDLKKKGTLF